MNSTNSSIRYGHAADSSKFEKSDLMVCRKYCWHEVSQLRSKHWSLNSPQPPHQDEVEKLGPCVLGDRSPCMSRLQELAPIIHQGPAAVAYQQNLPHGKGNIKVDALLPLLRSRGGSSSQVCATWIGCCFFTHTPTHLSTTYECMKAQSKNSVPLTPLSSTGRRSYRPP